MKNRVDVEERTTKIARPTELNFNFSTTATEFYQDENVNFTFKSTPSENDYSPSSEMSSSKKIIDKPTFVSFFHAQFDVQCPMKILPFHPLPQVKRITMGLLKVNDQESRPLGELKKKVLK